MSRCIRCRKHYNEPECEEGSHDCPHCGLTPFQRDRFFHDHDEEEDEGGAG